ncbi:hypothetical protein DRW41_18365 [Neobacillus piezotolerans]|uniref:Uncharacterized protein n=1 Tax=Neobacillus piezotolerans TaxID=2259171 RepID=A0A3D8GM35_9BACI|nr:hypothetical protein [Neobacillus piezotolerans]RDU35421.1 hypothetical protein DRW41_18365 [Neobacillus piezotolerans]
MERLFENPILLFVIIAFVSSMFSKLKGKDENRRPGRLPELARELQERYGEAAKPDQKGMDRRPARRQDSSTVTLSGKGEAAREAVNPSPLQDNAVEKSGDTGRRIVQNPGKGVGENLSIEPVTEKNLADAVVWAEILGPPRSKKPYYKR